MKILKIQSTIVPNFNMKLFLTSLVGFPEQQTNKQTNAKKTEENEMPFPLYILLSYETMIRHLMLTAFASVAITIKTLLSINKN